MVKAQDLPKVSPQESDQSKAVSSQSFRSITARVRHLRQVFTLVVKFRIGTPYAAHSSRVKITSRFQSSRAVALRAVSSPTADGNTELIFTQVLSLPQKRYCSLLTDHRSLITAFLRRLHQSHKQRMRMVRVDASCEWSCSSPNHQRQVDQRG